MSVNYYLMKAEPESRIEKGKDVKFSVEDFESVGTTAWEGVRNYEARNLMKNMKIGDKVAFYHSNCKNPGIAGFAEVSKEAYPDHTAWDTSHPYYDAKTDKDNPKWFMVDVTFSSRAKQLVPLSLMKRIASISDPDDIPEDIAYIGSEGVKAVKGMALVTRGRLSVQPLDKEAYDTICILADKGGWVGNIPPKTAKASSPSKKRGRPRGKAKSEPKADDEEEENDEEEDNEPSSSKKAKINEDDELETAPRRKSARTKKK